MTRKTIAILGLLLVLLVSFYGTVAAEAGDEPTATPTVEATLVPTLEATVEPTVAPTEMVAATEEPETDGEPATKFFTHPVVQLLSAYFDRDWQPAAAVTPDPLATPDPLVTPDPLGTPVPDDLDGESGLGPIGEQIATYHEDGMGFGVLVKIFAMAEAAKAACPVVVGEVDPAAEVCTAVSAEELVETFQSGTGMGALFKEYGKPALLGVGHVKKALKDLPVVDEPVVVDPTLEGEPTLLDAKGGKPVKVKPDNGKLDNGILEVNPNNSKPEKVKPENNGKGPKK